MTALLVHEESGVPALIAEAGLVVAGDEGGVVRAVVPDGAGGEEGGELRAGHHQSPVPPDLGVLGVRRNLRRRRRALDICSRIIARNLSRSC